MVWTCGEIGRVPNFWRVLMAEVSGGWIQKRLKLN